MKWIAAIVFTVVTGTVWAGDGGQDEPGRKAWNRECSSCHVAYPAEFLSAGNWERLMKGLDQHFGDNASLDAGVRQAILGYLKSHAGKGSRRSAKTLRITDTRWFRGEHDEVPAKAWKDPAVHSPANCTACHVNAAKGDWSEHGVRMPAGLRMEDKDDD